MAEEAALQDGDTGVIATTDSNNTTPDNQVQENGGQQPPAQGPGFWGIAKTLIVRCLFMYMVTSFLRRGSTPAAPETTSPDGKTLPSIAASNIYGKETEMDLYVYVSESEFFTDFDNKDELVWFEEELRYGDWNSGIQNDGSYYKELQFSISKEVQNNGSLFIHTYIVQSGNSPDPSDKKKYFKQTTLYQSKRLTKYKKRKFHTTKNLITGEADAHPDLLRADTNETSEIINTWHPNMTIVLVEDFTPWTQGAVPAPLNEFIEFVPGAKYKPILFYNDYWNLQKDYMPINETTPLLNLSLTYTPMTLFKWQMYAAQTMKNKWYQNILGADVMGEESDEEQDSLKETLVETNPYLLGLTIVVSLVHSVFEFLAFKNDIQFWRNRKSLEGLSVRSVFFNVFQSLIVVLYVMDNETNMVIKISVVVGLFIEMWKIFKVVDFKFDYENKILGLPRPTFKDKSTYVESDTKKYDKLAFKYLSVLLFPLLVAYTVYSLIYQEHRGWYSWVLNILYGFLLTFGFIMMTPQLFINYKLKSVAHLPWRMLSYKALNTFIDDLFAFVIKMPILYRIGCFRDDIVFLIFLYQRYIYPVDRSRVNEFGVSAEMLENPEAAAAAAAAAQEVNGAIENTKTTPEPSSKTTPTKPKGKKAKKND